MPGKWITIRKTPKAAFRAWMARPDGGSGPVLVLLQEIFGVNRQMREMADAFAAEGYVVLVPDLFWRLEPGIELGFSDKERTQAFDYYGRFDLELGMRDLGEVVKLARKLPKTTGKVGVTGYCLGGLLAWLAAARLKVDGAVGYYGVGIEKHLAEARKITCPLLLHFGEIDKWTPPAVIAKIRKATAKSGNVAMHVYPGADHGFSNSHRPAFNRSAAGLAHSRTIGLLRRAIGPRYDLEALWEQHTFFEFGARDVAATMRTMVGAPYVNHIPVLTGGVGHDDLARFYKYHFIPKCPADTKLVPVSRTVGADRIVDEMLFCFTHDTEIDWMLPGVKPTGRYVEVPLVAIVNFRGSKLYHEHIYWDQASVLVQIGLLDPAGLPVAGHDQARKLLDTSLPSNRLMRRWRESEGKPAP